MAQLRRRMIDDMTIPNMSPNTQKIYIRAAANFSAYRGRSPDTLSFEDARPQGQHDQRDHMRRALAGRRHGIGQSLA